MTRIAPFVVNENSKSSTFPLASLYGRQIWLVSPFLHLCPTPLYLLLKNVNIQPFLQPELVHEAQHK